MSKILLYSDMHIGAERVQISAIINTLKWINDLASQRGITNIFNLGDLFDFYNHTKSKMKITPDFMAMINEFGDLLKGHYVLRGNHEYHEEGDLLTVLELYGANVIVEPKELNIDNKNILFFPYYDDKDLGNLNFSFRDNYDYVFGHCDVSGASFESGFSDVRRDSKTLSLFNFDKMYIGHYHIKQQIRSNIWSIGSCQSRVRTNNEARMGITILDVETGETEFIENPYAEYNASETVKLVGTQFEATKKYNLTDEIDNFKLEKSGLDTIIEYAKTKRGVYDDSIIDYTIEYLEGLKK